MFHSRGLNNRINKIHEKALRLVYNDNQLTFSELFDKDNSVTIHERNLQALATEVYKSINGLSSVIMRGIFDARSNCRSSSILCRGNVKTVRGSKIWALVSDSIKVSNSLHEFKSKIRKWKPVGCDCKICKEYVPNLGFLN